MSEPTVSVITPAYNAAQTLRACVDSIRAQSLSDWEHIIVDDGSTDSTWDLLNKLAEEDSRLQIMRQANAGQGKARNVAIEKARGRYIALLDADDRSLPERLELQVAFLGAHPDVDVLGAAIINVSETGENLGVSRLSPDHDTLVADIYCRCPFSTSTVMARPAFFRVSGGFSETLRLRRVEDYDLWHRGYRQFHYHNLQVPLVYYRRNTAPSWRDAIYSACVIMKAINRDRKPLTYGWYALRPLVVTLLRQLGLRRSFS